MTALVLVLTGLAGCASIPEGAITRPVVKLRDIEVLGLGFKGQTFLLTFDVSNPNPFPLPLNSIRYGLELDGQRFASGETPCNISIPAGGQADFSISVELDLLSTAPQLLTLVRDGKRSEIPYELRGEFGIDVPFVPTVSYRTDGAIRLD
jgi:LEA14-like dessication related protein